MNASVSILRPAASNPATRPELTAALRATVGARAAAALALCRHCPPPCQLTCKAGNTADHNASDRAAAEPARAACRQTGLGRAAGC